MFDFPRKLNSQTGETVISEEANNTLTKNAVRTDSANMASSPQVDSPERQNRRESATDYPGRETSRKSALLADTHQSFSVEVTL